MRCSCGVVWCGVVLSVVSKLRSLPFKGKRDTKSKGDDREVSTALRCFALRCFGLRCVALPCLVWLVCMFSVVLC